MPADGVKESRSEVNKRFTQNATIIQTVGDKFKLAYAVVKPRASNDFHVKFAAKPHFSYATDELYDVNDLGAGSDKAKRVIFAFDNGVFRARTNDNTRRASRSST